MSRSPTISVAGELVKNELPDEFAALLAAPFGKSLNVCHFTRAELCCDADQPISPAFFCLGGKLIFT
jgi:hypothetical protein